MTLFKLDETQKKVLLTRISQVLIAAGASAQQLTSPNAFRQALVTFASQPSVREDIWNACVQSLQT